MEDFDNEHEIALDEALGRIRGDSNESDEDFFDLENTDVVVGRQYNVNNNHSKYVCPVASCCHHVRTTFLLLVVSSYCVCHLVAIQGASQLNYLSIM